jgi:hypothetical protein
VCVFVCVFVYVFGVCVCVCVCVSIYKHAYIQHTYIHARTHTHTHTQGAVFFRSYNVLFDLTHSSARVPPTLGLGKIDPSYTILGISDYAADVKVKKKIENDKKKLQPMSIQQ